MKNSSRFLGQESTGSGIMVVGSFPSHRSALVRLQQRFWLLASSTRAYGFGFSLARLVFASASALAQAGKRLQLRSPGSPDLSLDFLRCRSCSPSLTWTSAFIRPRWTLVGIAEIQILDPECCR